MNKSQRPDLEQAHMQPQTHPQQPPPAQTHPPRTDPHAAPVYGQQSPACGGMPQYGGTPYSGGARYGDRLGDDSPLGALSLSRILRVLMRKWWIVLLTCAMGYGGASVYLRRLTPLYEASAIIELSVRRPRILSQQGAVIEDAGSGAEQVFNTRLQKFQSSATYELAKTKYKQMKQGPCDDAALRRLPRGAKFVLIRGTSLLKVTYRHTDPEEARLSAAAIVAAVEESSALENRSASDSAVAWLETQVVAQRKDLEKAEQTVLDFRSANKLDAMANQRKTIEESLMSFNSDLVKLESQEAMAKDLLAALATFEADPVNIGKMPAAAPRVDEIRIAHERWMAAVAERDGLLTRYTLQHPEVQARDKAIALVRSQTVDAIRRSRETAASNLALLEKQAESLRAKKAEQSKLSAEIEQKIVEARTRLNALERERDASEASYKGVLNRIEEARLAADENTANVKIIEQPSLPRGTVWPNRRRIIDIGLLLGFMGGFILALVVDKIEDRLVSPLDIERDLGLSLIGAIPHLGGTGKRETVALTSVQNKLSPFAEAFAGLRASLDSSRYRDAAAVLLVSSSMPGEGKTIVSANIAATCALHGQRVLLIDFDLRRPRMGTMFRMPPDRPSLLDVLSGTEVYPWELLPFDAECPGLQIIASRPVRGRSPADVMGGAKVRELLAWARSNYDRVILDAPPVGIVSDAVVLAGYADSVILVTRVQKSRKRATAYTAARFAELGVKNILVVANDVNYKRGHHAYGRYYHYHYKAYTEQKG